MKQVTVKSHFGCTSQLGTLFGQVVCNDGNTVVVRTNDCSITVMRR